MQTESSPSADETTPLGQSRILGTLQQQLPDWSKWTKRLKSRKKLTVRKLLGPNAMLWGLASADAIHCSTTARLVQLKFAGKREDEFAWNEAAEQWANSVRENATSLLAVEGIAWAHALPALTSRLPQDDWLDLLAALLNVSQPIVATKTDDRVVQVMLTSELPMTLAYTLPELAICKQRAEAARNQFSTSMDAMLDGEGMPHAQHLRSIQLLLASCTRILTLDAVTKKGKIGKAARLQFDWLCRQALRWARPNGTPIFSVDTASPHFDELIKSALNITDDDSDLAAYKLLRGKKKSVNDDVPPESEHSEWSEIATLRTSWLPNASRLAVSFADRTLEAELSVGSSVIFSGKCMPSVMVDGEQLLPQSDWEEVCWETDDDMDFIELDCTLANGWRIQRQFLLGRKDSFALIADALIGPGTGSIRYRHALPLHKGVVLDEQDETTETILLGDKRLGTVLPISLSEWSSANPTNRLRGDPARLEINQRASALFAPLFIDLDPARRNKALTWRTLTVAENLQPVPSDVAVAFRVQIGKKQWLIYRSLAAVGNRTFLGINSISEFLVARFNPDGEIEPIIDVTA